MTESKSLGLTNINALHTFRHDATNKLEKLILTLLFKLTFKFAIKPKSREIHTNPFSCL